MTFRTASTQKDHSAPPVSEFPRVALLTESATEWSRSILAGIEHYLRKGRYWQIFMEPHGALDSLRIPKGWTGEGIIADIRDAAMARHLCSLKIPVVKISQPVFEKMPFPTVTSDLAACIRMGVEYYFARGFQNLAYLRLDRNALDHENCRLFGEFVEGSGGRFFPRAVKMRGWGVPDWNLSIRDLAEWLTGLPKPVGIFSWAIGREVVYACHLARLRMPEEVSLLMIGDDAIYLGMSLIPISGLIHPGREIGSTAAEMLDQLMSGKKLAEGEKIRLLKPLGVNTRQSSDVMAVDDPALRAALAFIRENRSRPIQVDDVARHSGISRRVMEQRFAKVLEASPADYIREAHLERAKELLRETSLAIPDVAEASGFGSPEYMAQFFKARVGMPPIRYRLKVTAR